MKTPLIKICGITDEATATAAIKAGADYIGCIFHKPSSRHVELDQAYQIVQATKKAGGEVVGVFVEQDATEIQAICDYLDISVAQLHGDKARQSHDLLNKHIQKIYVLTVKKNGEINADQTLNISSLNPHCDMILYDGEVAGSGERYCLNHFRHRYALPYIVAGGINETNVADVIHCVNPDGIDISSGVEKNGQKDLSLIQRFIRASSNPLQCVGAY